ncbi:hypothetical protein ABT158_15735 [Nonomuraea sp. NPDC001636]|uniref:hypothetical protein n=1 Tax=Nonomuraea sp. NPDC001636 TaxID=3154391 RepID=UPI00332A23F8
MAHPAPTAAAAVPHASHVNASAAIHQPRAHEMNLYEIDGADALILILSTNHVWFNLSTAEGDREANAEAMERLATLAAEAATRLRRTGEQP